MEDNIPLESSNKKKFEETISGIKKLIKSGELVPGKKKNKVKVKKSSNNRGVIYIGHIPHGFYEEQMRSYFGQFGKVTNVRVARSKRTGRSKGYGFVEFLEKEVAEIAAETMNNYLMDKRLLKSEVIPAERLLPKLFQGQNWTEKSHPAKNRRVKAVKLYNKEISHEQWLKQCRKQMKRLNSTKSKLKELGIEYDFTPINVPEELLNKIDGDKTQINTKSQSLNDSDNSPIVKLKRKSKQSKPTSGDNADSKVKGNLKSKTKPVEPENKSSNVKSTNTDKSSKTAAVQKKGSRGIQKKTKTNEKKNALNEKTVKKQAMKMMQSNLVKVIDGKKSNASPVKKPKRKNKK